jgi:hypothetical protein
MGISGQAVVVLITQTNTIIKYVLNELSLPSLISAFNDKPTLILTTDS